MKKILSVFILFIYFSSNIIATDIDNKSSNTELRYEIGPELDFSADSGLNKHLISIADSENGGWKTVYSKVSLHDTVQFYTYNPSYKQMISKKRLAEASADNNCEGYLSIVPIVKVNYTSSDSSKEVYLNNNETYWIPPNMVKIGRSSNSIVRLYGDDFEAEYIATFVVENSFLTPAFSESVTLKY